MSTVHVDIGVNSAFMTRRYEKPETWVTMIKKLGFDVVSFDSDALDPFFSGDLAYVLGVAREVGKLAKEADLKVSDYFTGFASYRFFGLGHQAPEQRSRMTEWVRGSIQIAAAMGSRGMGGRFDAFSVETLENPTELERRYNGVIESYRDLAVEAGKAGLEALYFEQMYVPSLIPYTIDQTYDYIRNVNKDRKGVTVRPVVDLGHMCGQEYGVKGDDLLYEKWMEKFAAACHVIHIQQTRRRASDHGPFASSCKGDIDMGVVLQTLEKSIKNAANEAWSEYLDVPKQIYLILEALPSTRESEQQVLEQLHESNDYLRKYVPKGGLWL